MVSPAHQFPRTVRKPGLSPKRRGRKAATRRGDGDADRPVIWVEGGGLSDQATAGEEAIVLCGAPVYQRGSALVRPVLQEVAAADGRRSKVAQLAAVALPYMRDLLCRSAEWRKIDGPRGAAIAIDPPPAVAQVILHRFGEWHFRSVAGVITTPTMRPDGSLLIRPGYDEMTRLVLCDPPEMPPIPDNPRREDALAALALLDSLLDEFPFVDSGSRSVALSALITPVVRGAFPVTPMHVISAPEAGSGKSYLLDVAAAIAIGQPCPVMAVGRTEEETEKRLGAALLSGQTIIAIDNVNGDLGGDALCQIIERPVVEIRILGKSERVRVETRSTMFATGNNIRLVADMTRRVLHCRLDPKVERPELRQFGRRPTEAVLADRGRYVAAALTVVRSFIAAGMPWRARRLASFEGWSDLVRSTLIWLDRVDPVETMKIARMHDPSRQIMAAAFEALHDAVGTNKLTTASQLVALANTKAVTTGEAACDGTQDAWLYPDLRSVLLSIAGKDGGIDARELGKWLSRHRDRIAAKLRLEGKSDRNGHAARWWLVRTDGSGSQMGIFIPTRISGPERTGCP